MKLNEKFVKENFSEIESFLIDPSYYRGVINGARVYYNENEMARTERELSNYQDNLDSASSKSNNKSLVKATAAGRGYIEEELPKGAFISVYFYAMITMVGFVIGVIYLFASILGT